MWCREAGRRGACARKDLYTSSYFSLKRRYAEEIGDFWSILSAEHGLLPPTKEILPYETSIDDLDEDQRDHLAHSVGMDLIDWIADFASQEIEVERVVAHDQSHVMPILWAAGTSAEAVTEALEADSTIEDVRRIVDLDDEWLYQMRWVDNIRVVVRSLVHERGTITSAYGMNDRWSFRLVFPDHDALSRTYDYCQEEGLTLEIVSVTEMDSEPAGQYGLTELQYEALVTAYQMGYFEIPQDTTIEGVADELGISAQSASERLRRGHRKLIGGALPATIEEARTRE